MLRALVTSPGSVVSRGELLALLRLEGCDDDAAVIESVERVLDLSFFTASERARYADIPIVAADETGFRLEPTLAAELRADQTALDHVRDAVETGLAIARRAGTWQGRLERGERYGRKDVCRLLNWPTNATSTMFGYSLDRASGTVPIFITYHKHDSISETTQYGDEFIDPSLLTWFTRSKRTLASTLEGRIARNEFALPVFVKKDDTEGTDFFYLGAAQVLEAEDATMPGSDISVVRMKLELEAPVEPSLYSYLTA